MITRTPKCKKCGNRYPIGYDFGKGIPTMVGMKQSDGKTINICGKCMCEIGAMSKEEKDEFFKAIQER